MILEYKVRAGAIQPARANPSDAGLDVFYNPSDPEVSAIKIHPGENKMLPTGLSFGIPHGYMLQVCNRSSMGVKRSLVVGAHIIDSGRFEEWPNLFTDPCTYQITTRDNYDRGFPISIILCDSHGMLKDRVVSIRTANVFEPHRYRHIVSCVEIIGKKGNEWSLRSNYLVTRTMLNGTMSVFSTGEYQDIIVQKEEKFL